MSRTREERKLATKRMVVKLAAIWLAIIFGTVVGWVI